ncbi:hypothetical protein NFI96_006495 [Prochilodus magdalenae]|nr:hypothetical protein NFI96_006495 [Prochilodus magdalenae]
MLAYGFGLIDAALMVQKAVQFQSVSDHRKCKESVALQPVRILPSGGEVSVAVQSGGCRGRRNQINTLEHVQDFSFQFVWYKRCISVPNAVITAGHEEKRRVSSRTQELDTDDRTELGRRSTRNMETDPVHVTGAGTTTIVIPPRVSSSRNRTTCTQTVTTTVLNTTSPSPKTAVVSYQTGIE